jgi:hypothetical protein
MHQIQQLQARMSRFQQELSSIASMVQQLASSEQANQQQLQHLSQKEQHASRQLQQIQMMCQNASQEIQQLSSLASQLSKSSGSGGGSLQGGFSGSVGGSGVSYVPNISSYTQISPTAGISEINTSPTGSPDYGSAYGSYGMSGGSSYSGSSYSNLGGSGFGMSFGSQGGYGSSSYGSGYIPTISTATQPSPKAGVSDSSYSPAGNPDYGSSYGIGGGSLNAGLGRS